MSALLRRLSRIVRARWLRAAGPDDPWPPWPSPEWEADRWEGGKGRGEAPAGRERSGEEEARRRALAVLELDRGASADEIRAAYRSLCLRYHPDFFAGDDAKACTANALLAEINRAYELLTSSR